LINIYRTPVSGVFRRNAFWFRDLWRKPGQHFAICGKNPAAQIVQVEQLNERARVRRRRREFIALLCSEAAWPLAARAAGDDTLMSCLIRANSHGPGTGQTRESHDRIFYQFGQPRD
jgi:hypothetical protein